MTRETKVGLLVGLGMILLIGIIVSDHLSVVSQQEAFTPTHFAEQAQRSLNGDSPAATTPGMRQDMAAEAPAPQAPVPLAEELRQPPRDTMTTDLTAEQPPRQTYPMRAYALDSRDGRPSVQEMVTQVPGASDTAATQVTPPGADPRLAMLGQSGDFTSVRHELDRGTPGATMPGSETLRFRETVPAPRDESVRPAPPPPAVAQPATYTVKPGDSFSKIAREHLGSDSRWREVFELNRDKVESPEALQAGMEIRLPRSNTPVAATPAPDRADVAMPVVIDTTTPSQPQRLQDLRATQRQARTTDSAAARTPAPAKTYVVQRGDTLTKIAEKTLGDGSQWRKLYQVNKTRIDDPDAVQVGVELTIPQS